ncbi:MAG TPA: FumA C-terminus/TtdB family hydratase beta subunit [Candidatus Atribacteria bacterium]|nr:FumA C-terminus/TtdB family hydratase beta subunit [Candidatus Atribacteria bacterium]
MEERKEIILKTPLSVEEVQPLRAGDKIYLNGVIYAARDLTHQRLIEDLEAGKELPFSLSGSVIYYAGPTPARRGEIIGSIGPTTSSRMDKYLEYFLQRGLRATIGKGERKEEVKELLEKYGAVYLLACGGAGAYLSTFVVEKEILAYQDLGAQALLRLKVKQFPLVVAYDTQGGDIFEQGRIKYRDIALYNKF